MHAGVAGLLWSAPEVLRQGSNVITIPVTPKADVYSFAIIMHEVVTRGLPYNMSKDDKPESNSRFQLCEKRIFMDHTNSHC